MIFCLSLACRELCCRQYCREQNAKLAAMTDIVQQQIGQLPEILRSQVSRDWQALVESGGHEGLKPALLEDLVHVWAASPQTAHYCLREPRLLREWQQDDGHLPPADVEGYGRMFGQALAQATSKNEAKQALRKLRNREMLRIAWRDIAGQDELDETLAALSGLADAAAGAALDWLVEHYRERFGIARDAQGQELRLVIIGMGKLGGGELNFSSDIDLIFTYPEPGQTDGPRSLTTEEYFRRIAQELVALLNEPTADGFVFRVDTRLRPFGNSGPLVMHFGAMEQYYQSHGREWERYAWIKARPIAGDIAAGEELLELLRPFVYRRYLDYGAFDALREMKAMIVQEIRRKGMENNIKLGAGGIREIEFMVQVFQLIHGGRHEDLRCRRLREVLPALVRHGLLPEQAAKALDDAYVFLRRLENRMQAYADRQVHELPEHDQPRAALALAMHSPGWHDALGVIQAYRDHVHELFDRVFVAPQVQSDDDDPQARLVALWRGGMPEDAALKLLSSEGYNQAPRALEQIDHLRDGIRYMTVGEQSRRRLDRCVVLLLSAAAQQEQSEIVLERLFEVLRAIAGRSNYVALLVENPTALSQLVRLCAASPWISGQVAQSPVFLDFMLDPRQLYAPPLRDGLVGELQAMSAQADADDVEQQMEILRRFKHSAVLRVAAADVSNAMPLMVVSDRLTEIAEVVVGHCLKQAWRQTARKHGEPRKADGSIAGLLVIAYGKFGGFEMGYGSDLDLVFVHDGEAQSSTDGERPVSHAVFFARLGQRIIHWLSTYTPAGRAYEVDMRLRPSGQSGLLVTGFDALEGYQRDSAWTWEHQALVRARPVAGEAALRERFLALRQEILSNRREPAALRKDVIEMREKMRTALEKREAGRFDLKQGRGGIADIEFIVQYNVLRWTGEHPQLAEYPDNIRIIERLVSSGLWDGEDGETLCEAYRHLRREMHRLSLQEQPSLIASDNLLQEREFVELCWQRYLEQSA